MLNFPDAPAADQTFDATPIKRFTWKGDRWRRMPGTTPPPPVLARLIPSDALTGSGPIAVAVEGANFTPASEILWDGIAIPTVYVSPSELRCDGRQSLVDAEVPVRVRTLAEISAETLIFTWYTTASVPILAGIAPTSCGKTPAIEIVCDGFYFTAGTTWTINGDPITDTVSDPPYRYFLTIDTRPYTGPCEIRARNPGGGESDAQILTVT